jgi:hypothetical protein
MKMLVIGMKKVGLENKVSTILSRWNEIPLVANTQPVAEYQYAYPDDLMNDVADLFLNSLKETGFALVSEKIVRSQDDNIVSILNRAWALFWEDPEAFTKWEAQTVQKLKSQLS